MSKKYDFAHFKNNETGERFDMTISYKISGRWYIYRSVFCEEEMICAIRNAYETPGVTEVKTKMNF